MHPLLLLLLHFLLDQFQRASPCSSKYKEIDNSLLSKIIVLPGKIAILSNLTGISIYLSKTLFPSKSKTYSPSELYPSSFSSATLEFTEISFNDISSILFDKPLVI